MKWQEKKHMMPKKAQMHGELDTLQVQEVLKNMVALCKDQALMVTQQALTIMSIDLME